MAKNCRYCASDLNEGAVFCKECHHFQTLASRLLNVSNTTLALLVALLAVVTSLTQVLTSLEADKSAKLMVANITDDGPPTFLVSNRGEIDTAIGDLRMGFCVGEHGTLLHEEQITAIHEVDLWSVCPNGHFEFPLSKNSVFPPNKEPNLLLVKAGESKLIELDKSIWMHQTESDYIEMSPNSDERRAFFDLLEKVNDSKIGAICFLYYKHLEVDGVYTETAQRSECWSTIRAIEWH